MKYDATHYASIARYVIIPWCTVVRDPDTNLPS